MRTALLLGLCLSACHTTALTGEPAPSRVESLVAGNWEPVEEASWYDPTRCETGYHRTWLSDDGATLYQTHGEQGPDPAEVLAADDRYLTIRYPNETRVDENGDPLIWYMVFVGDDSYFWITSRRADPDPDDPEQVRAAYGSGFSYHRCPAS